MPHLSPPLWQPTLVWLGVEEEDTINANRQMGSLWLLFYWSKTGGTRVLNQAPTSIHQRHKLSIWSHAHHLTIIVICFVRKGDIVDHTWSAHQNGGEKERERERPHGGWTRCTCRVGNHSHFLCIMVGLLCS